MFTTFLFCSSFSVRVVEVEQRVEFAFADE